MLGEPVRDLAGLAFHPGPETVLAPMRLVGDHDDVPAVGQGRVFGLPAFGSELLDGREHHAPGGAGQDPLQVLSAIGLLRGLTKEVLARGESAEELIVEVVAVGDDDDGGVLHRRVGDDLSRVEGHDEALAGALGMPDHADAPVALGARSGDRTLDRVAHGMELVIPGHDLDQTRARVLEHGEVADQGQEPGLLEHPLDDRSELGHPLRSDGGAVHGTPGHEPFEIGGQGAQAGVEAVRGGEGGVGAEEGGDLVLVRLELVEGPFEGRVLVAGVLEFYHGQRETVDEQNQVGAPVMAVLDHRVLVHREPVVGVHIVEVDQPGHISADTPVLAGDLNRYSFDQVAVQAAVLLDEGGGLGLLDLAQDLFEGLGRQVRVEASEPFV